jgi:hypothetical protein
MPLLIWFLVGWTEFSHFSKSGVNLVHFEDYIGHLPRETENENRNSFRNMSVGIRLYSVILVRAIRPPNSSTEIARR